MALINSKEQLHEKISSCEACLAAKLDGSNGKRSLLVCGGTGCLASESKEILQITYRGEKTAVSFFGVGIS